MEEEEEGREPSQLDPEETEGEEGRRPQVNHEKGKKGGERSEKCQQKGYRPPFKEFVLRAIFIPHSTTHSVVVLCLVHPW